MMSASVLALTVWATTVNCEPVDSIKMIGQFPAITAIYSTSAAADGQNLQCLRADLKEYEPNDNNIIYTWIHKDDTGKERAVDHKIYKGFAPNRVLDVTADDPSTLAVATATYTDYKTCYVLKVDGQCILWANNDFKDNLPEECTAKYKESCGDGVLIYDKEVCNTGPTP